MCFCSWQIQKSSAFLYYLLSLSLNFTEINALPPTKACLDGLFLLTVLHRPCLKGMRAKNPSPLDRAMTVAEPEREA